MRSANAMLDLVRNFTAEDRPAFAFIAHHNFISLSARRLWHGTCLRGFYEMRPVGMVKTEQASFAAEDPR
jgi:hypothetical protein